MNFLNKLENETRLEAIRYWLCNNTRPAAIYNTISRYGYQDRLYKSIKGERYIDYDYCSWGLDGAIVDILENTLDIYTADICQDSNKEFIEASEDIKEHIEIYKNSLYETDNQAYFRGDIALNIILQYIHKYRNRLWF